MSTIAAALVKAQHKLVTSDSPRLDAEVLLGFVLQRDRAYLYTWPEQELSLDQQQLYLSLLERRAHGEPVAYLVGYKDFWSLTLAVNDSTLIPRPETELLVEQALQRLPKTFCQVLDMGTGCGAIALALAVERKAWEIYACDSNEEAVKLAISNGKKLGLTQANFFHSHWFDQVEKNNFDLIVSNPPYIDKNDEHLLVGDIRFEPRSALVADRQGFADLVCIIDQARSHLRWGGWLMLEHGFSQGDAIRLHMEECGYASVETCRDLAGCERLTLGQWQ